MVFASASVEAATTAAAAEAALKGPRLSGLTMAAPIVVCECDDLLTGICSGEPNNGKDVFEPTLEPKPAALGGRGTGDGPLEKR